MLAKQEVATCLYFCGLMMVIITLHFAEDTPEVPAYACLAHHYLASCASLALMACLAAAPMRSKGYLAAHLNKSDSRTWALMLTNESPSLFTLHATSSWLNKG